ncbi:MAG: histidine--tRNA ligase [Gammaproteobacteria bacterium]|nr:histidine--tRNA ligase [Gammaproteobacteria bacterium]
MSQFKTPRGTTDRLPEEQHVWDSVIGAFERACKLHGFGRIQTPTIESADLFLRAVGEETDIGSKELYTLDDRGGEHLALRPEGTAPVVRAYNEHGMKVRSQPVRLYYIAPNFRYDRPQAGRYREHNQMGAEVLGEADAAVDVGVISLIWDVLGNLGLTGLRLEINSIGDAVCRPSYRDALVDYYKDGLHELCDDCKRRFKSNPLRLLDCKKEHCHEVAGQAPHSIDFLCDDCSDHFAGLQEGLNALEIAYTINARLVRGLDYYTRTVFEIAPPEAGSQGALAGGGRYDLLSEYIGGDPLPGMGFGSGIERVILILQEQNMAAPEAVRPDAFVAPLSPATKPIATALSSKLRSIGVATISGYRDASARSHLRRANSAGARLAILIGDRDVAGGTVSVRDMDGKTQTDVKLDEAARSIKELLVN